MAILPVLERLWSLLVVSSSVCVDSMHFFVFKFIRYTQISCEEKMVQQDFQFLCFLKTTALYYSTNQLQFPLVCLKLNKILYVL